MLKIFRKKKREEETSNTEWWKNPCLDDEGTYDYLAMPLPSDSINFTHSSCKSRCDCCGKYSSFYYRYYHYFYTIDGYDSLDSTECWRCVTKDKMRRFWRKTFLYKALSKKPHKKHPIKITYNH